MFRCMDISTIDFMTLAGVAGILAFLWSLHRDMRNLSDRVSKLEGLMEGLRDAITARS